MINGTQLILNKVYDAVGFDAISDDVLRNLVIARICQPGSKMATSAYLKAYFKEDLNHWRIYSYMDKLYNTQQETAEASRLPGPGPGVSIMSPVPSSCMEKKKRTTRKIVLFPIWGAMWGSNPRHPEPQSGALPTELIAPCQLDCKGENNFLTVQVFRTDKLGK